MSAVTVPRTLGLFVVSALLSACMGGAVPPQSLRQTGAAFSSMPAPAGYRVIFSFDGKKDGDGPRGALLAVKGFFYGITTGGGKFGNGVVFRISPSGQQAVVYAFKGGTSDGRIPNGPLIEVNGVLYGTTTRGGANDSGIFFSLTTSGKEKVIYSFGSTESPTGALFYDKGVFLGTEVGFGSDRGSVYKITPQGAFKAIYYFQGQPDCYNPLDSGITVVKSILYGTARYGGAFGNGCIFKIKAGKEGVLYSFKGGKDAQQPTSGVIAVNGTLYGTAGGGTKSDGTVFRATLLGKEHVLYAFKGYPNDGSVPNSPPLDIKGNLYGVTDSGGPHNSGTIFKVDAAGHETVLYAFKGQPDGSSPAGALIDSSGKLYGTTSSGGKYGVGTVFTI